MSHAFYQLKTESLSHCTRPFKARGSIVKRCSKCNLALFACLCPWQLTRTSDIHFILIVHRKELYKTTNSGHLIADLLPNSTSAYLWSRTEPDPTLLAEIANPSRRVVLLFPEDQTHATENRVTNIRIPTDDRPLTVVLLDGTWKQASRMANLSQWLQNIERLSITFDSEDSIGDSHSGGKKNRYIRRAPEQHQLSTAQAAAAVLREVGSSENENAALLEHYFSVFNQHCIATRRNIKPSVSDSHRALSQAQQKPTKDTT